MAQQKNTRPRITEIAMDTYRTRDYIDAVISGGYPRSSEKRLWQIDPELPPEQWTGGEISGLTASSLRDNGNLKQRWPEIADFLNRIVEKPACLLAHNGNNFDFRLLRDEMERYENELTPLCKDIYVGDTMQIIMEVERQYAHEVCMAVEDYRLSIQIDRLEEDSISYLPGFTDHKRKRNDLKVDERHGNTGMQDRQNECKCLFYGMKRTPEKLERTSGRVTERMHAQGVKYVEAATLQNCFLKGKVSWSTLENTEGMRNDETPWENLTCQQNTPVVQQMGDDHPSSRRTRKLNEMVKTCWVEGIQCHKMRDKKTFTCATKRKLALDVQKNVYHYGYTIYNLCRSRNVYPILTIEGGFNSVLVQLTISRFNSSGRTTKRFSCK